MRSPGPDRLRAEIRSRPFDLYLLTVTAAGYRQVSLLWPPAEPGGYSLMADGAAGPGQAGTLIVTVTRAVLHRRGPAPAGSTASCGSDCIPLTG
jgi:hypothetical protein